MITQERVREVLHYDEESGIFTWKGTNLIATGRHTKGGYLRLNIDEDRYLAHRIAWLYVHGYMPEFIDHINGRGDDNRIANLREVTHAQNMWNSKKSSIGVEKHGAKFRARIWVNNKRIELGSFTYEDLAERAYLRAVNKYHGEFAYINRPLVRRA